MTHTQKSTTHWNCRKTEHKGSECCGCFPKDDCLPEEIGGSSMTIHEPNKKTCNRCNEPIDEGILCKQCKDALLTKQRTKGNVMEDDAI